MDFVVSPACDNDLKSSEMRSEINVHDRMWSTPHFLEEDRNFDECYEDLLLFTAPPTPAGRKVKVYISCALGRCHCMHSLEGEKTQLKPCRFAYLLFGGCVEFMDSFWPVYVGVTDGFKIVDGDVPSYHCHNYNSILGNHTKPMMDKIIRRELAEGCISIVSKKPICLHSLGAVPKGPTDIRPITDCSRPPGRSVNNFCGSLLTKFSYSSIHDAVKLFERGWFLSVVDIKSAYRAVSNAPEHRNYLGFEWTLDDKSEYYVDN